jgi:hypothetical protein
MTRYLTRRVTGRPTRGVMRARIRQP